MGVSFEKVPVGSTWGRPQLADLWGLRGYQALARGVFTPAGDSKLILFVTEEKQRTFRAYLDRLEDDRLTWEGPDDHFAEQRLSESESAGDDVHLFYRARHHTPFRYLGTMTLESATLHRDRPSVFEFRLRAVPSET